MKKAMSLLLMLAVLAGLLTACGGGSSGGEEAALDSNLPTYDSLKVGEDYTDLTAELRVVTHRTDLVDNVFPPRRYAEPLFQRQRLPRLRQGREEFGVLRKH